MFFYFSHTGRSVVSLWCRAFTPKSFRSRHGLATLSLFGAGPSVVSGRCQVVSETPAASVLLWEVQP